VPRNLLRLLCHAVTINVVGDIEVSLRDVGVADLEVFHAQEQNPEAGTVAPRSGTQCQPQAEERGQDHEDDRRGGGPDLAPSLCPAGRRDDAVGSAFVPFPRALGQGGRQESELQLIDAVRRIGVAAPVTFTHTTMTIV